MFRLRLSFGSVERLVLGALALMAVAACGDGMQLAGVSGGGTGAAVASGTVTGFGSLIVDGKTWDDSSASVRVELDPQAGAVPATAQLGQQVKLSFEVDGQATSITLRPNVIGAVTQAGANELIVLGQRVRVNLDPNAGPVTVLEGVNAASAISVGQLLEVHGQWVRDTATGRPVVQATRLAVRTSAAGGFALIAGTVDGLNTVAGSFRIGDLPVTTGAGTRWPGGTAGIANGRQATVWSRTPLLAGPTLSAEFVRVDAAPSPGVPAYLAGSVARFDRVAGTFVIDEVVVDAHAATLTPAGSTLADGQYVRAHGTFDAAGRFNADQITLRRSDSEVEASLRGTVTAYVSKAAFAVRGVPVDASTAQIDLSACPAGTSTLANGLFVRVDGHVQASGVRATAVRCDTEGAGATLSLSGTIAALDAAHHAFQLPPSANAAGPTISWNDDTVFDAPLTAATLANGQAVAVDAVLGASGLRARRVSPR